MLLLQLEGGQHKQRVMPFTERRTPGKAWERLRLRQGRCVLRQEQGAAQELTPQKPQMPLLLPAIPDGAESEGVLKAWQRRSAQEGPEFYL